MEKPALFHPVADDGHGLGFFIVVSRAGAAKSRFIRILGVGIVALHCRHMGEVAHVLSFFDCTNFTPKPGGQVVHHHRDNRQYSSTVHIIFMLR